MGQNRGRSTRLLVALAAFAGALTFAAPAGAAIPSVFGGAVTCSPAGDGVRECSGKVDTFDGVPIDVNVAFPPEPSGTDGDYPLIGEFHGWGGSKIGFGASGSNSGLRRWTSQGYAAFSMSDRGWGESCGSLASRLADPAGCAQGWIRLLDTRFEVRDAQEFFGRLADEELIDPQRIGSTGSSYGGGLSMALAALRDRKMMPDSQLVPWTSPADGKAMRIAAAAPDIPWTDLAYSLVPNGRTLDYVADAPYDFPIGVKKESFVDGLFALGAAGGYYAPPGADEDADLTTWYALINSGEPYDSNPLTPGIVEEIKLHHSSYYIGHSQPPAPLLISNGWTDDLFPPDEAIRFYNRTRTQFPGTPISLFFSSAGHQRGQNKAADTAQRFAARDAWFAHFVRGDGSTPLDGVTTLTQTCPNDAPSGGPFTAPTWREISPGEVRFFSDPAQTVQPATSPSQSGQAFDPIAGGGACANASAADLGGAATYRLPAAPAGGYTLMGSPTVIASVDSPGPHSQLASRLLDVSPNGGETLVARGIYRLGPGATGQKVFQLHPNGYRFEQGHVPKLELLPNDAPYSRPTNGQQAVTVSKLELRLPTLEPPAAGCPVQSPAPKVVPEGYSLAIDYQSNGGAADVCAKTCAQAKPQRGTRHRDDLRGTKAADRIFGRRGNDRVAGRRGNDCLRGGGGDDVVIGGKGRDKLKGGRGSDRVRARDGERDKVRCGSGEDFVRADRRDKVSGGCEHVRRRKR